MSGLVIILLLVDIAVKLVVKKTSITNWVILERDGNRFGNFF